MMDTTNPETNREPGPPGGLADEVAQAVQGTIIPEPRNRAEARAALAEGLSRTSRKRRQKGGVRRLILMPLDAALVLRGDGRVQTHLPRALKVARGTAGYWAAMFRWILSANGEDADDVRAVLMERFEASMADLARSRAPAPEPSPAEEDARREQEQDGADLPG